MIESLMSDEKLDKIKSKIREQETRDFIRKAYSEIKEKYSGLPFPDKSPEELWREELEPIFKKAEEEKQISDVFRLLTQYHDKILIINRDNTNTYIIDEVLDDRDDATKVTKESFVVYVPEFSKNEVTICKKEQ